MPPPGMLRHVALVRTEVSEERIASIIRMTRIGELRTTLAVPSNRNTLRRNNILVVIANIPSSPILVTLMMEATHSSETSVLTRAKLHNILEGGILHSHRRKTSDLTWPCRCLATFRRYVLSSVHQIVRDGM
jgi:hypothetical protein